MTYISIDRHLDWQTSLMTYISIDRHLDWQISLMTDISIDRHLYWHLYWQTSLLTDISIDRHRLGTYRHTTRIEVCISQDSRYCTWTCICCVVTSAYCALRDVTLYRRVWRHLVMLCATSLVVLWVTSPCHAVWWRHLVVLCGDVDVSHRRIQLFRINGRWPAFGGNIDSITTDVAATIRFLHRSNGVERCCHSGQYGSTYVRTDVYPPRNVRLCTTIKRLELEAPISALLCVLSRNARTPIFMQIVDSFPFIFTAKDWNRVHWQIHAW